MGGGAGDGTIDRYEFKTALRNYGLGIGREKLVDAIFSECDKSGEGSVDFTEFASVLNKDEEDTSTGLLGGLNRTQKKIRKNIPPIGLKRLEQIVQDKIEQKAKGKSTGAMAVTSPHVLRRMFSDFDEDGTGELDYEEFANALRQGLGLVDYPGSSKLSPDATPEERLGILVKEIKNTLLNKSKGMRDAFRKIGGAGDGTVDKYELKAALRSNGIGIGNESAIDMLFDKCDDDKSGSIGFAEFAKVLNNEKEHSYFHKRESMQEKKRKRRGFVAPIGLQRLEKIIQDKIEQKAKGRSTGAQAVNSPHVLRQMFAEFDEDGSGELTHEEFSEALREKLGLENINERDMEQLMVSFDKDGDGTVTYDEFIAKVLPNEFPDEAGGFLDFPCVTKANTYSDDPETALRKLIKQVNETLVVKGKGIREEFRKLGGAGDGTIDKYEFKTALRNHGLGLGIPHIVDALFQKCDKGGEGSIDFSEFAAVLNAADEEVPMFRTGDMKKKSRARVAPIGLKRLEAIVKDKIEQKAKGKATGAMDVNSPHVLRKMF